MFVFIYIFIKQLRKSKYYEHTYQAVRGRNQKPNLFRLTERDWGKGYLDLLAFLLNTC